MIDIIAHRINTIHEIKNTPTKYGIEVDIRSYGDNLIIHHEPFHEGESFETWLREYQHRTLILNVKEEGLEDKLINLMKKFKITDYFFLDQSFPFLIRCAERGIFSCAVRVSQFESLNTAMKLAGKIKWVWVDYFTFFPLKYEDSKKLHEVGFSLCLVSPELQGHDPIISIPILQDILSSEKICFEAVCTKHPELWENYKVI